MAKKPAKKPRSKNPGKTAPKAAQSGGTLHALVICCDLYLPNSLPEGSYPSLRGCVSDARRVAEFLRTRAGLSDDRLTFLTSTPSAKDPGKPAEPPDKLPTYENIVGAFQRITKEMQDE